MTETKDEVSVFLEEATIERIEAQLSYGDSKSAWIREACEEKLQR